MRTTTFLSFFLLLLSYYVTLSIFHVPKKQKPSSGTSFFPESKRKYFFFFFFFFFIPHMKFHNKISFHNDLRITKTIWQIIVKTSFVFLFFSSILPFDTKPSAEKTSIIPNLLSIFPPSLSLSPFSSTSFSISFPFPCLVNFHERERKGARENKCKTRHSS